MCCSFVYKNIVDNPIYVRNLNEDFYNTTSEFVVEDFVGNKRKYSKADLMHLMRKNQLCVINLRIGISSNLEKMRCITVKSFEDIDKFIDSVDSNNKETVYTIGNKDIGYYEIAHKGGEVSIEMFYGAHKYVKFPDKISHIGALSFTGNSYVETIELSRNIVYLSDCILRYAPINLKQVIYNTEYKKFRDLIIHNNSYLLSMYEEISHNLPCVILNGTEIGLDDFISYVKNPGNIGLLKIFNREICNRLKDDSLIKYINKAYMIFGKDSVNIDVYSRILININVDKMIKSGNCIDVLKLPPIKKLMNNCFLISKDNFIKELVIPSTVSEDTLTITRLPYYNNYSLNEANIRVGKVVLESRESFKCVSESLGDLLIEIDGITKKAKDIEIKYEGLRVEIIDIFKYEKDYDNRVLIRDINSGTKKHIYLDRLIYAIVDGKVEPVNAKLYLNKEIEFNGRRYVSSDWRKTCSYM